MNNHLIEQQEEKEKLYEIVCNFSGEDIREYTRRHEVVSARVVFSKILLDENHRERNIAKFLGVDRSSIYHYKKIFENIINSDKVAKELYKKSKRYFYKNITFNEEKTNDFDKSEIMNELIETRKKYIDILNKYNDMHSIGSNSDIDTERFYDTFKAITLNVKKGREELLAKKIYNTINTVNSSLIY